jgi:hypothetical protein
MMAETDGSGQEHLFDIVIPCIRLIGIAMIFCGTAIGMGIGDLFIPEVGLFIAIMGLFEFFTVPAILTRVRDRHRDNFLSGRQFENRDHR